MTETCTIFDGLPHVDCKNEANEWGLCDEHTHEDAENVGGPDR